MVECDDSYYRTLVFACPGGVAYDDSSNDHRTYLFVDISCLFFLNISGETLMFRNGSFVFRMQGTLKDLKRLSNVNEASEVVGRLALPGVKRTSGKE